MQSHESEFGSENSRHLILPRNPHVSRDKTIVLVCLISILIGKIIFLFLQSRNIFGSNNEIMQLFDLIFAIPIGFVVYFLLYSFDYPEILASLLHDQQFLREQEKPVLVKCRFFYGGLGALIFYLGWSIGNLVLNIAFTSGIVGFISGSSVIYFLSQISNRMSKELNLPPIQKLNSPQKLIKQILLMIFLLGLLGVLYSVILLFGIYLYFYAQKNLQTGVFSQSEYDSSTFSSPIDSQTFWKHQFLSAIVINFACLFFLLPPPWFLGTISWQFSSLNVILLLLLPPLIIHILGYVVVNQRIRLFGLPIRRLILLFFSWVYLFLTPFFLRSSFTDFLLVSRFNQMELILINDNILIFLLVYLLLSPTIQIYSFVKSATTQLTFRSRNIYTRMFFIYGFSLLCLEVDIILLILFGFTLQLFQSFGIGAVGALLIVNICLLPVLVKSLREQYQQGIKKYL